MTRKVRPKRLAGRALATGAAATLLGLAFATPSSAHPLGNFTYNTSAAVQVRLDEVLVDYVIDLAELPTLQARPDVDRNGDDSLTDGERRRYAEKTCDTAAAGLTLTVGDRPVALERRSSDISFPEGQAGLSTLRLECGLGGSSTEIDGRTTVRLADENYADRLGWREIIALGDRTTVTDTDVLRESTSDSLVNYPQDQLDSPLRQREATITVEPGGPALVQDDDDSPIPLPSADRLSSLISERKLTIPFALFALGVSFVLGGFHAVAPGHGKTVMAAYLVGQRGARRQALLLGATVAVTHTGGVLALALVVSNSAVAPERFYPVLGSISGLLVVAIGVVLLRRAVQFRRIFPTLEPGASRHHHHGIGGHTHTHDLAPAAVGASGHDHGEATHDHARVPAAAHTEHQHTSHDHGHDHGPQHVDHDHGDGHVAHDHAHRDVDHAHGDVDHDHGDVDHDHGGPEHRALAGEPAVSLGPAMRARNMMAMGFAGGLVPSPSALVVLLGAIAIGRAWFGLLLIIAYGAGLAAVLVGAGLVIERLRHRIEPILARRSNSRLAGLAVNLPILTAVLVVLGGAYLVARALAVA